jgi:hypothetical protein
VGEPSEGIILLSWFNTWMILAEQGGSKELGVKMGGLGCCEFRAVWECGLSGQAVQVTSSCQQSGAGVPLSASAVK